MARYCIRLTNDKGKEIKLAGNEYIDMDVFDGNKRIAALTTRYGKLYDDNGDQILKRF